MRRTSLRILGAAAMIFCSPAYSFAAPVISSLNGTLLEGRSVEALGSGFGLKQPAAPQLWDRVDNQPSYAGLSDMDNIPATVYRGVAPSGIFTKYAASRAQRGARSAHYYAHGHVARTGWPIGVSDLKRVFVSFWYKPSLNPALGGSNKFFRVWDDPDGEGTRISWTQMHLTYPIVSNPLGGVSWGGWNGVTGQWNKLDMWVDADTHVIKTWTNGTLIHNITDFYKVSDYSAVPLYLGHIGFDNSGTGEFTEMDHDWGDIYIDKTPARIELCAGSSWSSRGICELQIPLSWGANSLSFQVNRGTFSAGQTAYLYAVNADGEVNSAGYQISIPAGDSVAPAAPSGLEVQ